MYCDDLHAVAPDFPAQAPGADGGVLPVVLDEADVVGAQVQADGLQRTQVEVLHVRRVRLQDHLVLVIVLQAVGVLAVAAVARTARGLDVGRVPRLGTQRAQDGGRVQGPRPHLDVVRLQDHAALGAPIVVERQDEILERPRFFLDFRGGHQGPNIPRIGARKSRRTIGPADWRFKHSDRWKGLVALGGGALAGVRQRRAVELAVFRGVGDRRVGDDVGVARLQAGLLIGRHRRDAAGGVGRRARRGHGRLGRGGRRRGRSGRRVGRAGSGRPGRRRSGPGSPVRRLRAVDWAMAAPDISARAAAAVAIRTNMGLILIEEIQPHQRSDLESVARITGS